MDLMRDVCNEYHLTPETVRYISNVYRIDLAFRNTPLRRLDGVSDLVEISMRMLRRIARDLGISNVNSIPTRPLLEHYIFNTYQRLINASSDEMNDTDERYDM